MKNYILILLFLILPINSFSQSNTNFYYNFQKFDINNLDIAMNNLGNFDGGTNGVGAYWKDLGESYNGSIVYQQGNILIGNYAGKRNMAYSAWFNMYAPGPIINKRPAMVVAPQDSVKYRVYKITKDKKNEIDYNEWPSEFGTPVDEKGEPILYGDQMLWSVYNSFDHSVWNRYGALPHFADSVSPLPIEIQQLTFTKQKEFEDVLFTELTIINKGEYTFKDVIFSLWTDIDFRDIFYNYPGVDTTLQLGYCWGKDTEYGISPAVGYQVLYGPKISSVGDQALFKGRYIENYKNLCITSFHGVVDDAVPEPPGDYSTYFDEIWNIAHGLESTGEEIIDSKTNLPTKFYWPGDPVTEEGWIYTDNFTSTGGGAGFYIFTGPFDIAPNDTQWVMYALFPELGETNLESIAKLREKAQLIKNTPYEELIKPSPGKLITETPIPETFELLQNYPNPFNSETTIKFKLPNDNFANLKIYNSLGEKVKSVFNQSFKAGEHSYKISMNEFSSGVYFYQLITNNFIDQKKMVLLK